MSRWSTAGFVPPPIYIGIPLFVLVQGFILFGLTKISSMHVSPVQTRIPGHALHKKYLQRQKEAPVHWSAARNEERSRSRS